MIPILFHLGPLPVYSFGLMMVLAFLSAWKCFEVSLEIAGKNSAIAERLITWAAVGGILGGRIGSLISNLEILINDPIGTIFNPAGFVFYWGLFGGVFACWYLLKKENVDFWGYADLAVPALCVGYAVGRIGCQLSGDGDYGMVSALPWALSYILGVVPTPVGVRVHPAPIYETIVALLLAIIFRQMQLKKVLSKRGQIFGLYLILSASVRFLVEFIRIEPKVFEWMSQAQLISLGLISCGAILLFISSKKENGLT